MVLDAYSQNQQTRDEISSEPSIQPIFKVKTEKVVFEEGPTVIVTGDASSTSALIWGHPTLGLWGSRLWGDGSDMSHTTTQIINPNNEFREHFRIIADVQGKPNNRYSQYTFIDTSNTTASVTAGSVTF